MRAVAAVAAVAASSSPLAARRRPFQCFLVLMRWQKETGRIHQGLPKKRRVARVAARAKV